MKPAAWKKFAIVLLHALVGWGLCGALIGIGRSITTLETTLIVHAVGVPIIFGGLSLLYFRISPYTTALETALFFTFVALFLDAFIIAPFVEKSYAMFSSVLGTWIPFGLIFLSTYLVGRLTTRTRGG